MIKDEIVKFEPEAASRMVRECVYRNGLCPEMFSCGYNKKAAFEDELKEYIKGFEIKSTTKRISEKETNNVRYYLLLQTRRK